MLCKGFSNDRGPSARKPRHRRFGPLHPAERLAQKFSYSIHEGRDSNTADNREFASRLGSGETDPSPPSANSAAGFGTTSQYRSLRGADAAEQVDVTRVGAHAIKYRILEAYESDIPMLVGLFQPEEGFVLVSQTEIVDCHRVRAIPSASAIASLLDPPLARAPDSRGLINLFQFFCHFGCTIQGEEPLVRIDSVVVHALGVVAIT